MRAARSGGSRQLARGARRSGLSAAAVAASTALLTGCSSIAGTSSESPGGFALPDDIDISAYRDVNAVLDSSAEKIVYPIDAYFVDAPTLDRFVRANSLLLDDCMREGGRTYPSSQFDLSSSSFESDTPYGIWSMEKAARFGYRGDRSLRSEVEAANDALIAADRADSEWGPAALKCETESERLPGIGRDAGGDGAVEIVELPQSIRNSAMMLASKRPEWEAARAAWSDCLVEHGLALRSDEQSPWAPLVPDDPEAAIRTAVIDVQCKEDARLVETLSSLEAQYQAAMIDQHRAALDEVAKTEAEYIARADEIIARHGGGTNG